MIQKINNKIFPSVLVLFFKCFPTFSKYVLGIINVSIESHSSAKQSSNGSGEILRPSLLPGVHVVQGHMQLRLQYKLATKPLST